MRTRLIISAVLLVPAVAASYMAWISWRAGDDGKWLFGVFGLFFLLMAAAPFLPSPAKKKEEEPAGTRFVSHWFMMLAILVVVVIVMAQIVTAVVRWLA